MPTGPGDPSQERLVSWKRIAAYLGCSERTARRWRNDEGLPIHNATNRASGTVFAFTNELDAWLHARPADRPATPSKTLPLASISRNVVGLSAFSAILAVTAIAIFLNWSPGRGSRTAANMSFDGVAINPVVVEPSRPDARALRDMAQSTFAVTLAGNGLHVVSSDADLSASAAVSLSGALIEGADEPTFSISLDDRYGGGLLWARSISAGDETSAAHAASTFAASVLRCMSEYHAAGPAFSTDALRHIARFCDSMLDDDAGLDTIAYARRVEASAPDHPTADAILAGSLGLSAIMTENWRLSETQINARLRGREIAEQILATDADNHLARSALVLIDASATLGDFAGAEKILTTALGDGLDDFYLPHIHARLLYLLGRHDEALQKYFKIAATHPYDGALRAKLAVILAAQGNNEMAYSHFERAMRDMPWRKVIPWTYLESAMFYGDPAIAGYLVNGAVGEKAQLSSAQRSCFNAFLDTRTEAANSNAAVEVCGNVEPWHQFRIFAALGEIDRAFGVVNDNWADAPTGVIYAMLPESELLRRDPRFWDGALKYGFVDYWRKTGNLPDFCREDDLMDCKAHFDASANY